jgi:hypothetical protein
MYGAIMYNRSRIWGSQTGDFGKTIGSHLWILRKKLNFFKHRNTHIRDHNVLPIWNMGVTEKKYVVSVNFPHKLAIFDQFFVANW